MQSRIKLRGGNAGNFHGAQNRMSEIQSHCPPAQLARPFTTFNMATNQAPTQRISAPGNLLSRIEPPSGAVFTCSIDDGHTSDLKTAELLHKYGIAGTFYIPLRNWEDACVLDPAQIRQIGRQFEVGSHTLDHCYLNYVNTRDAYRQIAHSKEQLEDILGQPVSGFCYPGGKYRQRDIELVRASGFLYARTTANLYFTAGSRPYEMPTTLQFFPHARGVYLRNFVRGGRWLKRRDGLFLALANDNWIIRLYAMFDYACENGGVFHLWWHSKQLDEHNAWPVLDAFLAHVAQSVPRRQCMTNAQLAARMGAGEVRSAVVR